MPTALPSVGSIHSPNLSPARELPKFAAGSQIVALGLPAL